MSPSTVLLEVFDIHVDIFAIEYLSMLDCSRHIQGASHAKVHMVVLVCPTATILHLQCLDLVVSNHDAIHFTIPVPIQAMHKTYHHVWEYQHSSAPTLTNMMASDPSDAMVDSLVVC